MKEFIDGYRYGVAGLGRLFEPGIRPFVIGPILLNGLVFSLGTVWLFRSLDRAQEAIETWLPDWLDWLSWVIWPFALVAVLAEVRKLLYFALLAIPALLIAVVPVVNVLTPVVWVVYGSWLFAIEYCEYPLGNMGLRLDRVRRALRSRRLLALGFGAGVMTLTLVPGLNLVAMPSAVIGACLLWGDRLSGESADL